MEFKFIRTGDNGCDFCGSEVPLCEDDHDPTDISSGGAAGGHYCEICFGTHAVTSVHHPTRYTADTRALLQAISVVGNMILQEVNPPKYNADRAPKVE